MFEDVPAGVSYLPPAVQSWNDWSPNTKFPQGSPTNDTSLKLSSNVCPAATVYTVPSTSTCAFFTPLVEMKMSSIWTWCPPIVVLEPLAAVPVGLGDPVPVGVGEPVPEDVGDGEPV